MQVYVTNRFDRCDRYHLRLEVEGIGSSRRLAAALQRLCLRCHCCVDAKNEIALVRRDWLPLELGGVGVVKQRASAYRYLKRLVGR